MTPLADAGMIDLQDFPNQGPLAASIALQIKLQAPGRYYCNCQDALDYLENLTREARRSIKHIRIARDLMMHDDERNTAFFEKLGEMIVLEIKPQIVTLVVPDDLEAGTSEDEEYAWFRWTLHDMMLAPLRVGDMREVRFEHPKCYSGEDPGVLDYHNMSTKLEPMLFDEEERRPFLCNFENRPIEQVNQDVYDRALRRERLMFWAESGFRLERLHVSRIPGQEATVHRPRGWQDDLTWDDEDLDVVRADMEDEKEREGCYTVVSVSRCRPPVRARGQGIP